MMRALLVLTALLIAACGAPKPPLVASDVEITRPLPGRHMSAGFLVLTNNTDEDIRITRVSSPQFGSIQIHETTIEDGIARMRELPALIVPAGSSVTLERGGKHLMLMRPEDIDESVSLQLYSDDVLALTIDYPMGDN